MLRLHARLNLEAASSLRKKEVSEVEIRREAFHLGFQEVKCLEAKPQKAISRTKIHWVLSSSQAQIMDSAFAIAAISRRVATFTDLFIVFSVYSGSSLRK